MAVNISRIRSQNTVLLIQTDIYVCCVIQQEATQVGAHISIFNLLKGYAGLEIVETSIRKLII